MVEVHHGSKLEYGQTKNAGQTFDSILRVLQQDKTIVAFTSETMQAYQPTGAVPITIEKQHDTREANAVMLSPPFAVANRSSPLSMSPARHMNSITTHANKVHLDKHVLQDAYTELALSHTAVLHESLVRVGVDDTPLEDVEDVESLHAVESLVTLAEACNRY